MLMYIVGNETEHQKYKKLLENLCRKNSEAKGIAIVIGISGPEGVELDVTNMASTFKELNFAVITQTDVTASELVSLVNIAAMYFYPLSYKFIVFYFAGHGGVDDRNGLPYVLPLQVLEEKVYIEQQIFSQFSVENSTSLQYRYRIFLFDCCLSSPSTRSDPENTSKKPKKFKLEARGGCLVAYSTSRSYKAVGNDYRGGLWTSYLHQNLKYPLAISTILDRTHDAVKKESLESGRIQQPNYHSCIGEVYLRGITLTVKNEIAFMLT